MSSQMYLIIAVIFLIEFILFIYYFTQRVYNGHIPKLRQIKGFEQIKGVTGQSIETGRPLHLSLGVGGLGNETTADTLAGISVLDYLAEKAAITGVSPTVSMTDPMAMLYAQNVLRTAHANDYDLAEAAYRHIRWIAPQPTAYAAGVMNLLAIDDAQANVMVGNFGDEYLLMGEVAARRKVTHVGGTSNPNTLPFIYVSADETLLGEEIYAAGAYLRERPSHIGSLVAQDSMRWIIVLVIFAGILFSSL
ncbi:hypothetical protein QUF58_11475 [Anaerolineales bacterium HSG24]|nr:hypothetical protein [Anaerolineales bacterium HSG24]